MDESAAQLRVNHELLCSGGRAKNAIFGSCLAIL